MLHHLQIEQPRAHQRQTDDHQKRRQQCAARKQRALSAMILEAGIDHASALIGKAPKSPDASA